jgi:hypothetical protein
MLRAGGIQDHQGLRRKASAAAGKLSGPKDLAEKHDAIVFAEIVSNRNDDGSYDRWTTFTIEDGELVKSEVAA